jgi:hypothetical protein
MSQSSLTNFVGTRLYSGNSAQIYIGLAILYSAELLNSLCGPFVSRLVSVLFKLVRPSRGEAGIDLHPYDYKAYRGSSEGIEDQEFQVPEIQQYKSYLDDRKANIGNEDHIYMLVTHGYNKHRFVSASFIKRNNLAKEKPSKAKKNSDKKG